MFTLDWSNKDALRLIDEYRKHSVLWDKMATGYKNKLKRLEAWTDIAAKFGCSNAEVERKMNVLLTQYRREKHKLMVKYYANKGEHYRSTWYAFSQFGFLENKNKYGNAATVMHGHIKEFSGNIKQAWTPDESVTKADCGKNDMFPKLLEQINYSSSPRPQSEETVSSEIPNHSSPTPLVIIHPDGSFSNPQQSSMPCTRQQQQQLMSNQMDNRIHHSNVSEQNHIQTMEKLPEVHNSLHTESHSSSGKNKRRHLKNNFKKTKNLQKNIQLIAEKVFNEDENDYVGANVTLKLRNMEKTQRVIAEKLIGEVLFYGQMNELTSLAAVYPTKDK